jgi:hypothetical protein
LDFGEIYFSLQRGDLERLRWIYNPAQSMLKGKNYSTFSTHSFHSSLQYLSISSHLHAFSESPSPGKFQTARNSSNIWNITRTRCISVNLPSLLPLWLSTPSLQHQLLFRLLFLKSAKV